MKERAVKTRAKKEGGGKAGKNKEGMNGGLWRARETQKYREDTMIEI